MEITLKKRGCNKETIEGIIYPVEDFIKESTLCKMNAQGLALYASTNFFTVKKLDRELEDSFLVGEYFDIKPLIQNRLPFYVLALNEDIVNLLKVEDNAIEKVDIKGLPKNFSEFTAFDEYEKNKQQHSTKQMSGPDHYRHGHGGKKDYHKIQMREFCKTIENHVTQFMNNISLPLFVVGANRLTSMYREVNSYLKIKTCESYNFKKISDISSVLPKLEEILRFEWKEKIEEEFNRFNPLMAKNDNKRKIQELVNKAQEGQIEKVFLDTQNYIWGEYSKVEHRAKIHKGHLWESDDLLNKVAVETLKHNGEVYPLPKKYRNKDYSAIVKSY